MATLAERLGHAPDATLLIITCDDLGLTHASNVATYDAVRDGLASSASLMVPCPWSRDAAAGYRGEDVGVLLTLNAEHDTYRWGPITHSPEPPRRRRRLPPHGRRRVGPRRPRRGARAGAGPRPSGRSCGASTSTMWPVTSARCSPPEFFDVYLELALDFGLPLRLARRRAARGRVPVPEARGRGGGGVPRPAMVRAPGERRRIERGLFERSPV